MIQVVDDDAVKRACNGGCVAEQRQVQPTAAQAALPGVPGVAGILQPCGQVGVKGGEWSFAVPGGVGPGWICGEDGFGLGSRSSGAGTWVVGKPCFCMCRNILLSRSRP